MVRFEAFSDDALVCDSMGEQSLIAIFRSYNAVLKEFNRLFARFGLTEPQFNIMLLLARQGKEGMVLSEIGNKMLVSKANITGLIDRLEREGLVVRENHADDRRARLAKMTEAGLDLLKKVVPLHCEKINTITSALEEEEKKRLVKSLTRLSQAIQGIGKG